MISLFKETVLQLETALIKLESLVDSPVFIEDPNYPRYRHNEQSSGTAAFLKAFRIVSALNASLVLLEKGFTQELGVLFRTVDEFLEDIVFLLTPQPDGKVSDAQQQFLDDFYQEEFNDPTSPMPSDQKRNRVARRKIHASLANTTSDIVNPSDGTEIRRTLSQAMSGFVHGAYPHIMENYGGNPPHYHLNGMLGTPIYDTHLDQSRHYYYRGIQAVMFLCQAFGDEDLLNELFNLRESFEKSASLTLSGEVEKMVAKLKKGRN